MIKKIKDNIVLLWASISIILLGSIILSLFTPVPNEKELVEKIIETEIYTTDNNDEVTMWTSLVNRVDQIEIDIKLLKNAYNNDQMTNLLEEGNEGGTIINYPPKWRFELKSPSSLD